MKRQSRLSRSRDFEVVYRRGRSVASRYLVLYWFRRAEPEGEPRLGLVVSRRVGGAAERNRLKRQLRSAFGEVAPGLQEDHDYVLIARPGLAEGAEQRGFAWLVDQIREVVARASAQAVEV